MLYAIGTIRVLIVPVVVSFFGEHEGNRHLCYGKMLKIVVKCDYRR